MSVGHVARAFETAGIPTVSVFVSAFAHVAERMQLPRTVVTPHPMGRPLGAAGDRERQRQVVETALDLLDTATEAPAVAVIDEPWRPGRVRRTGTPHA